MVSRRASRLGWSLLLLWATLGFALELAHGFKVSAYLDDELTRLLLRLAHAHGVALGLVVLVYSSVGAPLFRQDKAVGTAADRLLRFASVSLPAGFLFGSIAHPEGDPSVGIVLAPIGALSLIAALALLARQAFRA